MIRLQGRHSLLTPADALVAEPRCPHRRRIIHGASTDHQIAAQHLAELSGATARNSFHLAMATTRFAPLRIMPEMDNRGAGYSKTFFFEKKNQKTFVSWAYAAGENPDHDIKVFCFFSSEKKISSSVCWSLAISCQPHLFLSQALTVSYSGFFVSWRQTSAGSVFNAP
jgi:hypothetical protein